MGVTDGQPVNQAYTNPAFLDRRQDDTAIGKYTLSNTDPASGSSVTNIQAELNSEASFTGKSLNSAYNDVPSYTNNDVGSAGDPLKTRVDSLTQRFNSSAGHSHDGTTGNGPKIVASNLANVPYRGYVLQGTDLTSVTGTSKDVSSVMVGKAPGGDGSTLGVVTGAPYNKIVLRQASGANTGDSFLDANGNVVYGRLTYSTGVWTLSFYVLLSAVETAYNFTASSDISWYYQQIYNPMISPPTYSEFALIPSDNTTADIITATTTLQGKVSLATTAQSIGSSNSGGTANASVANADHTHQGVHSVAKNGSTALYGDVTVSAGTNITLTQSGQDILIAAGVGSGGGSLLFYDELDGFSDDYGFLPAKMIKRGNAFEFDQILNSSTYTEQGVICDLRVPTSYVYPADIKLKICFYSAATTGNYSFTVRVGLVRSVDQYEAPAYVSGTGYTGAINASANRLNKVTLDLTTSGQVDGAAVTAGDVLRVLIYINDAYHTIASKMTLVTAVSEVTFT